MILEPLASLLTRLSLAGRSQQPTTLVSPSSCISERLVRAAAQGEVHQVEQLLISHPDQVNAKHGGKTCLQVAAHQGHTRLVSLLLSIGASIEVFDDEGDRQGTIIIKYNNYSILCITLQIIIL